MSITLEQLVEHSRKKRIFAKKFGVSMRVVQKCIDELASFGLTTNGEFDVEDVIEYASDPENILYNLIDWTADTDTQKAQINVILQNISLLISSSDNKAFNIKLK